MKESHRNCRPRTEIICTLGPASRREEVLKRMVEAGMTMVRLAFSHGSHAEHAHSIALVRQVSSDLGVSLPILQDLQGPHLRTGRIEVRVKVGQEVVLFPAGRPRKRAEGRVYVPVRYAHLHEDVRPGNLILIHNARLQLEVERVEGCQVVCRVRTGGVIRGNKGLNVPGVEIRTPVLTEKDRGDLAFGLQEGIDWVALSFVKAAEDLRQLRDLMASLGPERVPSVMAKVERREALKNRQEILEEADAIMIARGDLALETSFAELPFWQKRLTAEARAKGKPVIVATGILESLTHRLIPSRGEVLDLANAVYDGVTGVLLSQETAVGQYPVEAVALAAQIIRAAEEQF
ncbi:MAG TPA: pyruvate kinase [Armatimonadetes bacterium]|nr:pyruvate kinase [Armatimonadota bacterium]